MADRTYAVHVPALSLQEAAMLPALPVRSAGKPPRNLLIPSAHLDFRQGDVDAGGHPVDNLSRRGSMAGRALLTCVKYASAQRRRR